MSFSRPSLKVLVQRARTDLESRLDGDPFLRRSFEYAIGAVVGGLSHGLHGHLDWLARQVVPGPDSDDQSILRWSALFLDPPRKQPTKATGSADFTGTNGTTIPAGTEVQLSDGTTYTTDADGTVSSGTVQVDVTASEAGEDGNADAGAKISLSSPIAGIDTDGTVASGGIDGGQDIEDIDDVFDRLKLRLANPPRGGGDGDFESWALETPTVDVDKAWEFPKRNGPGTVGLAFTVEDSDPIPSGSEVTSVQDYVESKMPTFMRSLDMITLTGVDLDIDISLKPNTTAVQDAVKAELEDLIDREAVPEEDFLLSHIREAISNAEGEEDHEITELQGSTTITDVSIGTGELLTYNAAKVNFSAL